MPHDMVHSKKAGGKEGMVRVAHTAVALPIKLSLLQTMSFLSFNSPLLFPITTREE